MKKTNNKGFSLVELIVVVAIMAVLMVVVAPQLLRYVEKTRVQRDESAAAEVLHVVEIAVADETVNSKLSATNVIEVKNGSIAAGATNPAPAELVKEVTDSFSGGSISLVSNTHKAQTYTITVTVPTGGGAPIVKGEWPTATP